MYWPYTKNSTGRELKLCFLLEMWTFTFRLILQLISTDHNLLMIILQFIIS